MNDLGDLFGGVPTSTLNNDGGNSSNNNSFNNSGILDDFTKQNKNSIDSIPNSLSENEMQEKVDIIIQKWSMNKNCPKNLLLLLSSLHEIWSRDEKLKDISLKDLVDDKGLASRVYRKSMLLFHDDKIKNLTTKEKYVAKSLYYLLTKAHEDYRAQG